jgi:predicted lipid-binding transport protein (Tim44 family)
VRRLVLTARGHGAVSAARQARAAVEAELREHLGARRVRGAERLLRDVVRAMGADDAVHMRRLRLPS